MQSSDLIYFCKKHHHVTVDHYLKINVYRSLYHSLEILEFSCDDLFPLEKMMLHFSVYNYYVFHALFVLYHNRRVKFTLFGKLLQ